VISICSFSEFAFGGQRKSFVTKSRARLRQDFGGRGFFCRQKTKIRARFAALGKIFSLPTPITAFFSNNIYVWRKKFLFSS
jgi:hypothetical protein